MSLAIVICNTCKKWVKLGEERSDASRSYCQTCYGKREKNFDYDLQGNKVRRKKEKKIEPLVVDEELGTPGDDQ